MTALLDARFPWLKRLANKLGIKSQSDWLFARSILKWTYDPKFHSQLPPHLRFFASYCRKMPAFTKNKRILFGRRLFSFLLSLNASNTTFASFPLKFRSFNTYLNLNDPRFLAVGDELISGDIPSFLQEWLEEGDTFIDVGANHGTFSILASEIVGKTGHVVSIEPQAQLAKNIEKTLAANSLSTFQVLQAAVGDENGKIDLVVPASTSGAAGVFPKYSGLGHHSTQSVPIKRFDDSFSWRNFPGKTFVKLDIEGSEPAFLQGAKDMIRTLQPTIYMEINPSALKAAGTNSEALIAQLKSLGYSTYRNADLDEPPRLLDSLDISGSPGGEDGGEQDILLTRDISAAASTA